MYSNPSFSAHLDQCAFVQCAFIFEYHPSVSAHLSFDQCAFPEEFLSFRKQNFEILLKMLLLSSFMQNKYRCMYGSFPTLISFYQNCKTELEIHLVPFSISAHFMLEFSAPLLQLLSLVQCAYCVPLSPLPLSFTQGPRKLKKSVGAKTQMFLKNDPLNSNFCFLLHFYTTIFKSQWVQMHPLHPLLRGPCLSIYLLQHCKGMERNNILYHTIYIDNLKPISSNSIRKKHTVISRQ